MPTNKALIEDLTRRTEQVKKQTLEWKELPLEQLQRKPSPKSWSVMECLAHLNHLGNIYLPEIEKQLAKGQKVDDPATANFKSSWLGDYFAKALMPAEEGKKVSKMPTLKSFDFSGSNLQRDVIDEFLRQQDWVLELLEKAKHYDLTRAKTRISVTSLIKIRLGDTFRVIVYHNQRHIQQGERALSLTAA